MRRTWLVGVVLAGMAARAGAEIPHEEYVEALTRNGYALLAIEYLKMQLARPGVSQEEAADLEFGIAAAMVAASTEISDLSKRELMLEDSRAQFRKYLEKYPNQPAVRKAEARVHVGTIDLQQGRLRTVQAQLPANIARAAELATDARKFLERAAEEYGKATEELQAENKKMPVFIPEDEKLLKKQKTHLFERYIEARFQTALARFYLADTYSSVDFMTLLEELRKGVGANSRILFTGEPPYRVESPQAAATLVLTSGKFAADGVPTIVIGKPEDDKAPAAVLPNAFRDVPEPLKARPAEIGKQFLAFEGKRKEITKNYLPAIDAALEGFKAIHEDHRRELVGLFGHLWMARCMAAKGEHRRAMGIYQLLQEHENKALEAFQRQVFHFMILSFVARKEWDQVINQGAEWSKGNVKFRRESAYLGVQYELAGAYFERALDTSDERERRKLLLEADQICEVLSRTSNEYTGLAQTLQLKVKEAMGRDPEKGAQSFHELFTLANATLDTLKPEMTPAQRKEILGRVKSLFQRALTAVKPEDLAERMDQMNDARISLAYAYIQDDDIYEAAVLCDFITRAYPMASVARQAAFFGVTAYAWAYDNARVMQQNQGADTHPEVDLERARRLAELADERWPEAKEVADMHMMLGRIDYGRKDYARASRHLDLVHAKSEDQIEAISLGGGAYWDWFKALTAEPARHTDLDADGDGKVVADELAATAVSPQDKEREKARFTKADKDGDGSLALDELRQWLREEARDHFTRASQPLRAARGGAVDRRIFVNDTLLGEVQFDRGDDDAVLATLTPLKQIIQENSAEGAKKTLPEDIDAPLRINVLTTMLQSLVRKNQLGEATDELVDLIGMQKGSGESGNVTVVLVNLAVRIKEQIQRLKAENKDDELAQLKSAFGQFLDKLAERETGQTIQSLVYIASNFIELENYDKAATLLQRTLEHPDVSDPKFAGNIIRARLYLVRCNRLLENFEEARKQIDDLLLEFMNMREVIIERGDVLDAGGEAISGNESYKLSIAHWKWVIKRFMQNKPRPEEFYFAMDRLIEVFKKVEGAEREKRLKEGYSLLKRVIELDLACPEEWKARYLRNIAFFEEELNLAVSQK